MITSEKKHLLYEYILNNGQIATKALKELGFNSNDINNLIKNNIIKRVERGKYEFVDLNILYIYTYSILKQKNYDQAYIWFSNLYDFGLRDANIYEQLFLLNVKRDNFNKALSFLQEMIKIEDDNQNIDYNLYLLLISNLVDIPDELEERLELIRNDITLLYLNDESKRQKINLSCYNANYSLATIQAEELLKKLGFDIRLMTIKLLCIKILCKNDLFINDLIELAKAKKYEKIVELLESKMNRNKLTTKEKLSLLITKGILDIKLNGFEPKENYIVANNTREAIKDKNYKLALEFSNKFEEYNNSKNNINILNILLKDIVELINSLELSSDIKKEITYEDIVNNIVQAEKSKLCNKLRVFLLQNEKIEYEYLLIRLYEIDLQKKDKSFSNMITEFNKIVQDPLYKIDFTSLIQSCFEFISQNNYVLAKLYLDILYHYDEDKKYTKLFDNLSDVINTSVRIEGNNQKISQIDNSKISEKNEIISSNSKESNQQREFIFKKAQELEESKELIILKPMNSIKRKKVHQIVEELPNVTSFSIGEDHNRRIVLKYQSPYEGYIDIKQIISNGESYYFNKQYRKAAEEILNAIAHLKKPTSYLFALVGYSYLKMQKLYKAIDYLTISSELAIAKGDYKHDLTSFIAYLKNEPINEDEEERKPNVLMSLKDFSVSRDNYQIKNLKNIVVDVLINGLDIDQISEIYEVTEDQINIIKLIIARTYYSNELYDFGDNILKKVERTPDKSETVKKLLEEVRLNRTLYRNREFDTFGMILARKLGNTENF